MLSPSECHHFASQGALGALGGVDRQRFSEVPGGRYGWFRGSTLVGCGISSKGLFGQCAMTISFLRVTIKMMPATMGSSLGSFLKSTSSQRLQSPTPFQDSSSNSQNVSRNRDFGV